MTARKPLVLILATLSRITGGAARKTRYTHTKTVYETNTVCYDEHGDQITCPHRPWTTLDTAMVCVAVAISLLLIALAIYLTFFKGVCHRDRSRSLLEGLTSSLRNWKCWRSRKYHKVIDTEQAPMPPQYDSSAVMSKSTTGGAPPTDGIPAPAVETYNVTTLYAYLPEGSESAYNQEKSDQWLTYDATSPGYAPSRPFPAPKDTLY